jgi:hypothetical protein
MQAPTGRGGIFLTFFYLGNRWGEWSESRTGRSLPPGSDPGTHWVGGWVDLTAGLDTEARGKNLCRGSNPGGPVCSQTLY